MRIFCIYVCATYFAFKKKMFIGIFNFEPQTFKNEYFSICDKKSFEFRRENGNRTQKREKLLQILPNDNSEITFTSVSSLIRNRDFFYLLFGVFLLMV